MKSFHVDKLYRPELWDLMDKMTYAHSPHMDPEKKSLLATKVTATFDDGFEDSIFLEACKVWSFRPLARCSSDGNNRELYRP